MDKAKAAVGDFLEKHGKKDTTVHENVNPAIVKETVAPQRHEEVQTAVDKETHQHHYHTSVQPVKDREILPEQHTHNLAATEHRTYDHGDTALDERKVAQEQAKFKDERVIADTKHTQSVAPVVGGEHVHHHVHETIQPVVQKETIQPQVVHTTVPVHEVHHNQAQHHGTSTLPTMTMDELKAKGGTLSGREERIDRFEGEPRGLTSGGVGSAIGGGSSSATHGTTGGVTGSSSTRDTGLTGGSTTSSSGLRDTVGGHSNTSTGTTGLTNPSGRDTSGYTDPSSRDTSGLTNPSSRDTSGLTNPSGRDTSGYTDPASRDTGAGLAGSTGYGQRSGTDGKFSQYGETGTDTSTSSTSKPSLKDKLDPRVDATGDGKAGFMK